MEASLREKQIKRREYILNGNLWKVVISVVLPLALYNLCNFLYGIYDMMIVQSANIGDAADIVVLDQIKNMISTIGASIASAGGIIVAKKFGEGKIEECRKSSNTVFTLGIVISIITLLFIPLGVPFLQLFKTDQSTIDNSLGYFNIQILVLFVTTLNSIMIALEKSKGSTKHLLYLNLGVIVLKIAMSTFFAYGPFENVNSSWLAFATLLSQLFMFGCLSFLCFKKSNILKICFKDFNLNPVIVKKLIHLAIPIFAGNFLFNFGKVFINSVATDTYGKTCVGALGISNTIAGVVNTVLNAFGDGTVVSQNYGNKNGKRIKKFFAIEFVYVSSIAIVGTFLLFIFRKSIAVFFAPNDINYQTMIINIFAWECFDLLFLGFGSIASAIFNGMGKTKITMAFSMSRLFLLRIPTLLILIYVVEMNYVACGITMFVSNTLCGIIQFIVTYSFIKKLDVKYPLLFN